MTGLSRRQRERQARRLSILAAAESVFARRGFSGATMEEVSRESEFGMSTLYKFFKGKRDLYFAIIDEKLSALQERLRQIVDANIPGQEALHDFLSRHLQFFEENINFFRIYIREKFGLADEPKEELSERIRARIAGYLDYAESALERWMREGHLGGGDARAKALALLSTVDAYLCRWLSESKENIGSPQRRASFILSIFSGSEDTAPAGAG